MLIQLKLIVTALLSVSLLGKVLVAGQWLAIFVLSAGVAAVQSSFVSSSSGGGGGFGDSFNPGIGIPAVLLSSVTSGMAGVYNERNVKVVHCCLFFCCLFFCCLMFFGLFFGV